MVYTLKACTCRPIKVLSHYNAIRRRSASNIKSLHGCYFLVATPYFVNHIEFILIMGRGICWDGFPHIRIHVDIWNSKQTPVWCANIIGLNYIGWVDWARAMGRGLWLEHVLCGGNVIFYSLDVWKASWEASCGGSCWGGNADDPQVDHVGSEVGCSPLVFSIKLRGVISYSWRVPHSDIPLSSISKYWTMHSRQWEWIAS